ncbi:MAG: DUF1385 domain-containing protein [Syntrophomonadaceae bacterium]|nr:DUF1385 domain-containing protein [Syntrophomonadaceae bacterium]
MNQGLQWAKCRPSGGDDPQARCRRLRRGAGLLAVSFQYGGQAVIEGVMMRGPRHVALAVRTPDGSVTVEKSEYCSLTERWRVLRWPFVRGAFVLADSLVIGMRALNRSASLAAAEEGEELSGREIAVTVAMAVAMAVVLFVLIPTGLAHLGREVIASALGQNMVEGVIRIAVFLGYVVAISRMEEIARVFMYHGAEHKAVHTLEQGDPLTVAHARPRSTLHPRCGTSFLLVVMVAAIFVFSLLGNGGLGWKVASRLVLLPLVAGIAYEFTRFTARYADRRWAQWLMAPGLWLQQLTTREPSDDQIEVAVRALAAVAEA